MLMTTDNTVDYDIMHLYDQLCPLKTVVQLGERGQTLNTTAAISIQIFR